jgi:hypothetical protein
MNTKEGVVIYGSFVFLAKSRPFPNNINVATNIFTSNERVEEIVIEYLKANNLNIEEWVDKIVIFRSKDRDGHIKILDDIKNGVSFHLILKSFLGMKIDTECPDALSTDILHGIRYNRWPKTNHEDALDILHTRDHNRWFTLDLDKEEPYFGLPYSRGGLIRTFKMLSRNGYSTEDIFNAVDKSIFSPLIRFLVNLDHKVKSKYETNRKWFGWSAEHKKITDDLGRNFWTIAEFIDEINFYKN